MASISAERSSLALSQLTAIGIALSAEKDLGRLLNLILREGRGLSQSDAASLFLIDKSIKGKDQLVFKLAENDSVVIDFVEQRFPLNKKSIAGYVALTGEIVNIADAYELKEVPYSFDPSFDQKSHYRTCSMLVLPMKNHKSEVIGVLQFINRKKNPQAKLTPEKIAQATLAYDAAIIDLLRALASQAAVAIENDILLANINALFEGFVKASVTAIEQRDPVTSGHSFRVANYTVALAIALPKACHPRFKQSFTAAQLKGLKYASLLHDFGKVGVREYVLVKEKKLFRQQLEAIRYRFRSEQERLKRIALEQHLYLLKQSLGKVTAQQEQCIYQSLEIKLKQLDKFLQAVETTNEPNMLPAKDFHYLQQILDYNLADTDAVSLLTQEEFLALSIPTGSLSAQERKEIESHVVHTQKFLQMIPWIAELGDIPAIAGAHHEKLDGSGYPQGLRAEHISLQSRIMTIADIYDALTASDRPYKPAMSTAKALTILVAEAERGKVDKDIMQIFIDAKVYSIAHDIEHAIHKSTTSAYARDVCDYELPTEHTHD